jgi:hypothetical protein
MIIYKKHVDDLRIGDIVKLPNEEITISGFNLPKRTNDGDVIFNGMNSIFFRAAGWSSDPNYLMVVNYENK